MTENRLWLAVAGLMVLFSVVCAALGRVGPASTTSITPPDQAMRTSTPVNRPPGVVGPGFTPGGLPPGGMGPGGMRGGGFTPGGQPGSTLTAPPRLGGMEPTDAALEEAFEAIAKTTKGGQLTCTLPPLTPTPALLESATHQHRKGDVIRAVVPEALGSTPLRDAKGKALAVVVWKDAWPGERGECVVEEARILEHRATFAGPVTSATVVGDCHDQTLEGENLVIRSIAGAPCRVRVLADEGQGEVVVREDEPRNDFVVTLGPPSDKTPEELEDTISAKLNAVDPIEAALGSPDLTPPAQAVLERWKATAP